VPLALITGASTGIGEATALRLARGGWTVLAGVRNDAAAAALSEKAAAGANGSGRVVPLTLDVTDAQQIAQAAARVQAESDGASDGSGRLDALVNNAGVGFGGPLELVTVEELRKQFDVNLIGAVAVTQAMLPALRHARGRIVFVSSIGGKVATPFVAPYAASKHAVEAVGDALRGELRTSNVRVALVEPGSVATPIWEKSRAEAERLSIPPELEGVYGKVPAAMGKFLEDTARRGIPPEKVAETIERALTASRMKTRYLVGGDARAMLLMRRLLPDAVFDRVIRRALGV
jgi:NAD(P)-dependent dehydrogenase (short-subunit alcohol dehydrogenase family)